MNNIQLNVIVNSKSYPLHSNSIPLHFLYYIYKDRVSKYSGRVHVMCYLDDNVNINDDLSIRVGNEVLYIGKIDKLFHNSRTYDMYINVENIFELWKSFISMWNYEYLNAVMYSFDTPKICNMKCPYCCVKCSENREELDVDSYVIQMYVDKLTNINKSTYKNFEIGCIRYMGGEPLLSQINLDKYFDFLKHNSNPKHTTLQVYTNGSVEGSFDKLNSKLREYEDWYKDWELWITLDSLNIKKTERFINEQQIENYIKNIKSIKKFNMNKCYSVNFNLMYIDDEEIENSIKFIKSNGYNRIKIALDEDNDDIDFDKFREDKRFSILNKYQDSMNFVKRGCRNTLPVTFKIYGVDTMLFRCLLRYDIGRNIIDIYKV